MNQPEPARAAADQGFMGPLRYPTFRNIWLASLLSNFGLLIQGVGAAWAMTQLTRAADKVALVQTAMMLPIMLFAIGAGALADMFDRRRVALAALLISLSGATALSCLDLLGLIQPNILLAGSFMVGLGMTLMGPAWQASVSEQVPQETLPSAIALNGISYNIARSFGPAIGGVIVAWAGAVAAFITNAVLYLPLLFVMYRWQRVQEPARLPPERIGRAIISGIRYTLHSPPVRVAVGRAFLMGGAGASVSALMPLVARDLLQGDATIYGLLLGAFGVGAVGGALCLNILRQRLGNEQIIRLASILMGLCVIVEALSPWRALTMLALLVAGAAWMIGVTVFNVSVQLSAPRWVAGRALATYQAALAGGIAIGSWMWGHVAAGHGVSTALIVSATALILSPLAGLFFAMHSDHGNADMNTNPRADPEVRLAITTRSGPVVIEIDYIVDPANARDFYRAMQGVQLIRQRNGGYGWSIARDIADPARWTERFHCPTWLDYLHQRSRQTQAEQEQWEQAVAFHIGPDPVRVRRMLERPFGSVRWKDDTPDWKVTDVLPLPSASGAGA